MKHQRILHICISDKFIEPFIRLVEEHFDRANHEFIFLGGNYQKYPIQAKENVMHCRSYLGLMQLSIKMQGAGKIIIHGLSVDPVKLLAVQPWLLKKCYWVMWGGDLYHYQLRPRGVKSDIQEAMRAFVIKRIGHFVTYVKGDYELAQKWYGAKGVYHNCFMYPSNLYKDYAVPPKQGDAINILVGNSADPTNNHAEVFEKLSLYKDDNIQIYCPLSYGSVDYAERVVKLGTELFGSKFIPLQDFMPFEEYLELLGQIDIAVFAHKRQQAMGNTITLLGLGKKVYMRRDVTPWALFSEIKVNVFDVAQIDINQLGLEEAKRNKAIIAGYFSEKKLIEQFAEIFSINNDER